MLVTFDFKTIACEAECNPPASDISICFVLWSLALGGLAKGEGLINGLAGHRGACQELG